MSFVNVKSYTSIQSLILIVTVIGILIKSYFSLNGYLTHDSFHYLAMAKSILDGNFVQYTVNGEKWNLFKDWPLGYPYILAIISLFLKGDIFLGSKLLNIFSLLGIFTLIYKSKKGSILVQYSLIFIGASLLVFTHTWSESIFMFFTFLLAYQIANLKSIGLPILTGILIFSIRYLGAFVILYLLILYIIRKRDVRYIKIALGIVLFIFGYFIFLKYQTGSFFGADRSGEIQSKLIVLGDYFYSLITQFSFFSFSHIQGKTGLFLFFIGYIPSIIFIYLLITKKIKFSLLFKNNTFFFHLFLIGISYIFFHFFVIIFLGWHNQNTVIPSRFFLVGIIPTIVGLSNFIKIQDPNFWTSKRIKMVLYSFAFVNIIYYCYIVPLKTNERYLKPNSKNITELRKEHNYYIKAE